MSSTEKGQEEPGLAMDDADIPDVNNDSGSTEKDREGPEMAVNDSGISAAKADIGESPSSLSSTISRKKCIFISGLILLSHGLFLWGQLDILWGQYAYTIVQYIGVDVDATANVTQAAAERAFNDTSLSAEGGQSYEIGAWSYGGMLNELWIYSKVTAVFLFVFSAFWPHLKLVLLHLYFYLAVPSKPRRAALYWLDTFGKFSLADVCATCMLFLLLNVEADLDVGTLAGHGSQLMGQVVPFINGSGVAGELSNKTQSLLSNAGSWAYEEVSELSEIIFQNEDPTKYKLLLEEGCSKFHNDGASCKGTPFYEPSNIGSTAGLMMKCMRIRDKCSQCECIVNNALYNHLIPGELLQSKANDALSTVFAKLLTAVRAQDVDFSSWFDVDGSASVGMYITIHPAFLGFTFAVILSIVASLVVSHVEEKDSMKRYRNASSLSDALENAQVEMGKASQLFDVEGNNRRGFKRLVFVVAGLGIIPLVFFAIYVEMFVVSISGLLLELLLMQASGTQTYYSLIDTVTVVNDGSGYGKTFAVLYGTFMLGVPMLRATLLAVVSIVPMPPLWQVHMTKISNDVGSYIGWEPFFICVLLLYAELPRLTEDTVSPAQCEALEDTTLISSFMATFGLDNTSTCFVMYFSILPAFALFVVSWACMTGFNALAWNAVMRRYDPFGTHSKEADSGGPYCNWKSCCYAGCFKKNRPDVQETPIDEKKAVDGETE